MSDKDHNTYGNNQDIYLAGSIYAYGGCTYIIYPHNTGGYYAHIWRRNDVFDTADTIAVGRARDAHHKARRLIKSLMV